MNRRAPSLLLAFLLLLPPLPAPGDDRPAGATPAGEAREATPDNVAQAQLPAQDVLSADNVWEGRVTVDRPLAVAAGAVLTVKPGTVVRFRKGAGLVVQGGLVAEGTGAAPIRFEPADDNVARGDWAGVSFTGGSSPSTMAHVTVRGAAVAVHAFGSSPAIRDCSFVEGRTGLVLEFKGTPSVTASAIRDMTEGGIRVQRGANPLVAGNTIESCGPFGVAASQDAIPVLRENVVAGCARGIELSGTVPPVEGNLFRKNRVGLSGARLSDRQVIRRNRFRENGEGLRAENFSAPLVEDNEFAGNEDALVCHHRSDPDVRNNRFEGNGRGIVCDRISNPRIEANDILGNRTGVFLTFSSYAVIRGNNIVGNRVQVELGNMSSDWENRVGKKPERGGQMQRMNRVSRGVAGPGELSRPPEEGAAVMGFVDAAGNWWGDGDTAEMEEKGADANIARLVDGHDVPTRTYEGYPGEYVQDRIKYQDWKKSRIAEAGIRNGESGK